MSSTIIQNMNASVYIHIPFCKARCFYCDFNTYAGKERLLPDYCAALREEINRQRGLETEPVHSVYFGGGTPSRLPVDEVAAVMDALREVFRLTDDAEVTFELNPCDVTAAYAEGLRGTGVNRVSLGMQSADPDELKLMGRRHTPEQVGEAVRTLRAAGFANISLDLIYGYPTQTIESWEHSLRTACSFGIEHISMYALNVEEGSALFRQLAAGKLTLPTDDLTVSMYEFAADFLAANGFDHYEISNWARDPRYESRHNKQYWLVAPYYGFGAGAHGWIDRERIRNTAGIADYIAAVRDNSGRFPAAAERIPQDRRTETQDVMMLGLRMLHEGITPERFEERFGEDMNEVFHRELRHLNQKRLILTDASGRITLDPAKVPVANQAFIEFVD